MRFKYDLTVDVNSIEKCSKNPFKRFPDYSFKLGRQEALYLVAGYLMGDGCFTQGYIRANTVSRELAYQLLVLLIKLGLRPRIKYIKRAGRWQGISGPIKRDQYGVELSVPDTRKFLNLVDSEPLLKKALEGKTINLKQSKQSSFQSFWTGDWLFNLLKDKSECFYEGEVYNLEVENDNSYVANGIILHNCDAARYALFTRETDKPAKPMVKPAGVRRATAGMFRGF